MARKGFAYRTQVTRGGIDNLEKLIAGFGDNFRDLQTHINGYLVAKDTDGDTVSITNLTLSGDLLVTNPITFSGGPEQAWMYRSGSAQSVGASSWVPVQYQSAQGSVGGPFSADVANYTIDYSEAGVYLVVAQVLFAAAESAYMRITVDGAEIARQANTSRTGLQVVALYAASAAGAFGAEVFVDTTADVQTGANDSYIKAVRLMGV